MIATRYILRSLLALSSTGLKLTSLRAQNTLVFEIDELIKKSQDKAEEFYKNK